MTVPNTVVPCQGGTCSPLDGKVKLTHSKKFDQQRTIIWHCLLQKRRRRQGSPRHLWKIQEMLLYPAFFSLKFEEVAYVSFLFIFQPKPRQRKRSAI